VLPPTPEPTATTPALHRNHNSSLRTIRRAPANGAAVVGVVAVVDNSIKADNRASAIGTMDVAGAISVDEADSGAAVSRMAHA
jgi:hypothetical protein